MDELSGAVAEPETGGIDLGSAESIETSTPEVETSEPAVEPDVATPDTEETETAPEQESDEEAVDPELKGLDPKYHRDKTVKGMFHALKALRTAYPGGVTEAVEVKKQLDALGGPGALAEIETQRKGWEQIDKDFAEGNPAVLEDWAKESPEGFVKLMGPALDKFQQTDPDAYNHSLGKIFWNTMQQFGVVNQLENLRGSLERGDVETAKAEIIKVAGFLKQINEFASKVPEKAKPNPEVERFQAEKTQWEQQKKQEFQNSVLDETRSYTVGKIEAQLGKEFQSRGVSLVKLKTSDPEAYQVLLSNCYDAVNKAVATDAGAFERFKTAVGAGKRADALNVAKGRVDAVFTDAVSKTYKAFSRIVGGKPNGAPAAAAPNGVPANKPAHGVMPLSKMPDPTTMDKQRMVAEFGADKANSMIMNGRIYLKGKQGMYQTP